MDETENALKSPLPTAQQTHPIQAASYSPPSPQYYNAPAPSYSLPAQYYDAPQQSYEGPQQSYGAPEGQKPKGSYGAKSQNSRDLI
ncbi:hypothetical protein DAPPUDRAFT_237377 [Daphnia pulex]|uniref:Uncharacterized protein n=1 Tax=Daphnia pulex TaxID=6669 RepID=E9G3S3_DAPPU|nr:hypothetical protein DAPPUDRAFT_237377 [Daphnia pulex]|eukprot:EFX85818.1 hypothetical protein DAPPUDRAFT_237377 [Daphnia pulex]